MTERNIMGNGGFRRVFLLIAMVAFVLAGCGKAGDTKEEQPNFIVQDVQTVARSTPSEAPAEETDSLEEPGESGEESEEEEVLQQYAVSTVQEDVTYAGEAEGKERMTAEEIKDLAAKAIVEMQKMEKEEIEACFYYEEVPEQVFERMKGKSYGEDCTIPLSELRYARVLHYGFDGQVHVGELIVNQAIAEDIIAIMKELFDAEYPIEKMVLIDEYNGDDNASMADNNTSSFNFRIVEGTSSLSRHAYGLAIDINPLYNPYLPVFDGVEKVLPENAAEYTDRNADCEYYILHGDICYQAFISRGFTWGGDWDSSKDYQHFSKVVE